MRRVHARHTPSNFACKLVECCMYDNSNHHKWWPRTHTHSTHRCRRQGWNDNKIFEIFRTFGIFIVNLTPSPNERRKSMHIINSFYDFDYRDGAHCTSQLHRGIINTLIHTYRTRHDIRIFDWIISTGRDFLRHFIVCVSAIVCFSMPNIYGIRNADVQTTQYVQCAHNRKSTSIRIECSLFRLVDVSSVRKMLENPRKKCQCQWDELIWFIQYPSADGSDHSWKECVGMFWRIVERVLLHVI